MQLLSDFLRSFEQNRSEEKASKIEALFIELGNYDLEAPDKKTLQELEDYFEKLKNEKRDPLQEKRNKSFKDALATFQGLMFDLKTRFDYASKEVAIQDGLDLNEYVKEVIEDVTEKLNQSMLNEIPEIIDLKVRLADYWLRFNRLNLKEFYLEGLEIFKMFREIQDEQFPQRAL